MFTFLVAEYISNVSRRTKTTTQVSPDLLVIGGESCSKGCEFESRQHILDGHIFTYLFVGKFFNVLLKRQK